MVNWQIQTMINLPATDATLVPVTFLHIGRSVLTCGEGPANSKGSIMFQTSCVGFTHQVGKPPYTYSLMYIKRT